MDSLLALDSAFVLEVASLLFVLPAGIMCVLPMHNQLKCSLPMALLRFFLLMVVLLPLTAYANLRFELDPNLLMVPLVLVLVAFLQLQVRCSLACTVAVVGFVSAFVCILANYANAYDAMLRPDASAATFSLEAALFQLALGVGSLVVLGWFLWSFGAELVDNLENNGIWLSALVVAFNIALYPDDYSLLQTRREFSGFLVEVSLLLLLLLLSTAMLYYTVTEILDKNRMEERNRMLELQESQFQNQRLYLEATARARHDFRQTIRTLKALSEEGEYQKLDEYLDDYIESMPSNTVVQYCHNNAVNALLNFYTRASKQAGVELNVAVSLDEDMPVGDVDLCNMLGNLLENALTAAKDAPEGRRWIDLVVDTQNDAQLVMVATNGMAGNIRTRNGEYRSTTHRGAGLGLRSIRDIAERHGGFAEFSHTDTEFHSNVMIPLV